MKMLPLIATKGKFVLLVAILLFASALASFFYKRPSPLVTPLLVKHPIARTLSQGKADSYSLHLETGKYCRLSIGDGNGNVEGTISDPGGARVLDFVCRQNGKTLVSFTTLVAGTYQLDLRLDAPLITSENYQVEVDELRDSSAQDQARIGAERAIAAADRLLREGKESALREALKKYDVALRLYHEIGTQPEVAMTLKMMGEVYLVLGEWNTARTRYQESLRVSQQVGEITAQADAHNGISYTSSQLADTKEAVEHYQAALQLSDVGKYRFGIAQAITNRAIVLSRAGKPQEALASCTEALMLWKELRKYQGQGLTYQRMGLAYVELGEPYKARDSYQQAVAAFQRARDQGGEAFTLTLLGHLYSLMGEKQEALNHYERAQPLVTALGNRTLEGSLMNGRGYFYEEFGDIKKALLYREKALSLYSSVQSRRNVAMTLMQLGRLNHADGNDAQALDHFNEAYAIFRSTGDRMLEAHVLKDLGMISAAQGSLRKAFNYYKKAFSLSDKNSDLRWRPYLLNDLGQMAQRLGRKHSAKARYLEALQLNQKNKDRVGETQTYVNLSNLAYGQGDLSQAQVYIEKASSLMESFRSKITNHELRTTYFATMHQYFELHTQILMQRHRQVRGAAFAAAALTISERFRARSLLELLHESRTEIVAGAEPRLLEQDLTLLRTLNGKAERKMQLAGKKEKEHELAALNQELESLNAQIEEIRAKMRETSPRYAALTQPQPLKANEIQHLLDENTMLLEFALGEERSYLWAVTKDSLEAFTLPNRATIEKLSNEVYALLTAAQKREGETFEQALLRGKQADQQYWPKAAELSQMLLSSIADKLGDQRLIVVGEGTLQRIPFVALPAPDLRVSRFEFRRQGRAARNPKPLVVNHEIVNLPSASILHVLRQERATRQAAASQKASPLDSLGAWLGNGTLSHAPTLDSIAILADPVFEKDDIRIRTGQQAQATTSQPQTRDVDLSDENLKLNRLPETAVEARAIEKAAGANAFLLKKDFAVNRALLESDELNRYGIIHFATHGFWDSENPELSGIVLSRYDQQGNKLDGFLRLSDIYNLRLPKELVVLSACETALGKDIRGEGLMALTRGFMYAGASRVIASLWKVEESATVDLMKVFYEKLLREKRTPAAALREAQIAMWRKAPTSAPYEWAAFVLQGEYR